MSAAVHPDLITSARVGAAETGVSREGGCELFTHEFIGVVFVDAKNISNDEVVAVEALVGAREEAIENCDKGGGRRPPWPHWEEGLGEPWSDERPIRCWGEV